MSLIKKPDSIHREETKDKILNLFKECRAKGNTVVDTAYETTALYYEISEDLRLENVKLGNKIIELEKQNKALKQLSAQKGLI